MRSPLLGWEILRRESGRVQAACRDCPQMVLPDIADDRTDGLERKIAHGLFNPVPEWVDSRTKRQKRSLRKSMKTNISARSDGLRKPSIALLAVCGAIGLLAGCASEPSSVVVSSP